MATRRDQRLLPSLLDRLLDDDPQVKRETDQGRHQLLGQMKRSVSRDLENLLNTRRRCLPVPDDLTELTTSLVNYGLPDFTGKHMASAETREAFRAALEDVIRNWEPRFKSVSVTMLEGAEPLDRTLRFRIDALMYADPAPEQLVFDSTLEPLTGDFEIKGAGIG